MVEKNARAAEHIVGFAVLLDDPVAVQFGYGIRTVGVERRSLGLRHFLHFAVQFAGGSLVDAAFRLQMVRAHRFQNTQYAYCIDIRRELGCVKRNLHVALRRQVVNLIGLHLSDQFDERHGVTHVGIMEMEMRRTLQMGDTLSVIDRTAADDTMHLVSFRQQKLGQIAAVLSRYTCYQCDFCHNNPN